MPLTEKLAWTTPPDIPGVECLSVENNQRPWCVFHETYAICNIDVFISEAGVPSGGESEWLYRSRLHRSPARSLSLMEPGEVHRNPTPSTGCNFSVLLIDPKLVSGMALELGLPQLPHFREAVTTDPRLYRSFLGFHAALANEAGLLHRQSLLINCIGGLVSARTETIPRPLTNPGRKRLERARDYLEQHFAENVSLDLLAELAGLSRFHFLRAFTREFGLPPHAYQNSLRIERVRLLLRKGMPIHSIEAGFADQSHLIRHFKRATGVTPGTYMAMTRDPRHTTNRESAGE